MYRPINIGSQIRYFRDKKCWSQENLALRAGLNPAFLGHIERGLKQPTVTTLDKIAKALDMPLYKLFQDIQETSDEYSESLQAIVFQMRDLPEEKLEQLSGIIRDIVAFSLPEQKEDD